MLAGVWLRCGTRVLVLLLVGARLFHSAVAAEVPEVLAGQRAWSMCTLRPFNAVGDGCDSRILAACISSRNEPNIKRWRSNQCRSMSRSNVAAYQMQRLTGCWYLARSCARGFKKAVWITNATLLRISRMRRYPSTLCELVSHCGSILYALYCLCMCWVGRCSDSCAVPCFLGSLSHWWAGCGALGRSV